MNNPALNARRVELEHASKRLAVLLDELRGQPADETLWAQVIRTARNAEHTAHLGLSAARKANVR